MNWRAIYQNIFPEVAEKPWSVTDPEVYYYTSGTLNGLHGTIGTVNRTLNGLHGTI
jgi:hypothetical protein